MNTAAMVGSTMVRDVCVFCVSECDVMMMMVCGQLSAFVVFVRCLFEIKDTSHENLTFFQNSIELN